MPCEGCGVQFTVLRRRKSCADCGRHFCAGCVVRSPPPRSPRSPASPASPEGRAPSLSFEGHGGVCAPCKVLAARPLARPQLDRLRVRDLQCYLQRQRVSTAGCVEKEDLVNLVISHVNSGNFIRRPPTRPQSELTRALASLKGFTTNLINSAFDIDPLSGDKTNKNRQNNNNAQNFPHTGGSSSSSQPNAASSKPTTSRSESNLNQRPASPESRNSSAAPQRDDGAPLQPPRCIVTDASAESEPNSANVELTDTHDCLEIEDDPDDPDWEIVTPPAEPLPQDSDILILDNDTPLRNSGRAASDLDLPSRTTDTPSDTSSLKNVSLTSSKISSSRINLNDLKELSQIECLNVKQLKELLILNRVDFKGCCERKELLERAERLWRESTKSREDLDNTGTEELCKICMDAPMECVMLECGHIATCVQCGKRLSECPICRQYVVRVVRIFKS